MLDFRVETFLAACQYMSYTKAAAALNITQPAVSQHIRYLEKAYKVSLFTYQGKQLELTEAGKQFLIAARTMKHDDAALKDSLAQADDGREKIALGATKTAGQFLLTKALSKYLQAKPELLVTFVMENTEVLFKQLHAGLLDCALIEGSFDKSEYDCLLYAKERYIAVCRSNYLFAQMPRQVEDLLEERLLVREEGSGSREILERFLKGKNLALTDFRKVCKINNINTIKAFLAAGVGISFLYEFAVQQELRQNKLRSLALEDFDIVHDITFLWRKNSIFADRYRQLFEQLQSYAS